MLRKNLLLAGVASCALALPAFAADDNAAILQRLDQMQKMMDAQQKQIEAQKAEINALKAELSKKAPAPQVAAAPPPPSPQPAPTDTAAQEKVAQQEKRIDALEQQVAQSNFDRQSQPSWSFANDRPFLSSPDGRFTLALRGLGQLDVAQFNQHGNPNLHILPAVNGPDLSSGANFRRVYLWLQGKLFNDWSYYFNYDFGGSTKGNEQQGRVQSMYVEYDGLAPWWFRLGAYPPPIHLEDATSPGDTIFLERSAPSDVARNVAGGDGRDAATAAYADDRFFGALSLSGGKVADTSLFFDEQLAAMGRLSYLAYSDDDTKFIVTANGTDVFKPGESTPGPASARNITFSGNPEITVDDNGTSLVSTGSINANHAFAYGFEGGLQWTSLYAQGGWFGYDIDRRASALSDPHFDGWYAQVSYFLTGEARVYNAATASFATPRPRVNFSLDEGGGWGAFEVAARYDVLDLNDRAGVIGAAAPADGIRGGEQKVWTLGLNWYPNANLKFMLDYERIDVDRIGNIAAVAGPGGHAAIDNTDVGQTIDAFALRSQIGF